jgi:glycosyltransferase involved in cell wall biosynthesis
MRIAMLNPPYRLPGDPSRWITVPPQSYGGIQWVVATLIDGLVAAGCTVALHGAPGSPKVDGLEVHDVVDAPGVTRWLKDNHVDIVHDHTDGVLPPSLDGIPALSTFHLTGCPRRRANCVYVSKAQRERADSESAPVIRLPVNPDRYLFEDRKDDYLLFLGRVSRHKGVIEAAEFATAAGVPLRVAGPSWEPDYFADLTERFPRTVEYEGAVGGRRRLELLAQARAVLVMSQPVAGPHGQTWSEPGATVVAEAAVSGTPIVSTANGCLPEIVPGVGAVLPSDTARECRRMAADDVLANLPGPHEVREVAIARWGHQRIAAEYLQAYRRLLSGEVWH